MEEGREREEDKSARERRDKRVSACPPDGPLSRRAAKCVGRNGPQTCGSQRPPGGGQVEVGPPRGLGPHRGLGGTRLCPAAADGRGSGELTSAEISGHLGGERGQERQCQEGRQATVDLRGTWTATRAGATPWLRKERPRPGRRPEEAFARGNGGATCVLEHEGSGARCVVLHGWTCRDGLGLAGRAGTAAGFPH